MSSREETHVMDPRDARRGNAEARFCGCDLRHPSLAAHDEAIVAARLASVEAPEFEAGVRQAIEWLRADYAYGEGPDWRERGCEWIADCLAEHTASLAVLGFDAHTEQKGTGE